MSIPIKERIYTVYENILKLIKERGYSDNIISNYNSADMIYYKINNFLKNRFSLSNTYLDILVSENDNKLFVKFILDDINKGTEKDTYKNLEKNYTDSLLINNLTQKDEIIFVYLDCEITNPLFRIINDFENNKENIRIMFYRNLLFNLVDHSLVPKHKLYTADRSVLYKELMIQNCDQLPAILSCDIVCKYYNFKPGDIIEIHRKNISNKIQIVYRYVKQFTGESPGKED